ncbi:hypothetical protein P4204_08370 [Pseudomonas aeruginosa]|nr:hypothetical protein [Pseudomonas aeruginosa]
MFGILLQDGCNATRPCFTATARACALRRTLNWVPSTVTRLSPLPTRNGRAGSWLTTKNTSPFFNSTSRVRSA